MKILVFGGSGKIGSTLEPFRFNKFGKDEELVCAITPGMPSFLKP